MSLVGEICTVAILSISGRIPIGITKQECNLHSACFNVIFSNSEKPYLLSKQDILRVWQGNGNNCCSAGYEKHIFVFKLK